GLVLAGVVAYNTWVTRRSTPRTVRDPMPPVSRDAEPSLGDEGLMSTDPVDRVEPVLGDPLVPGPDVAEPVEEGGTDTSAAAASVPAAEARTPPPAVVTLNQAVQVPDRRLGLDALIDVIAPLSLDAPVSG